MINLMPYDELNTITTYVEVAKRSKDLGITETEMVDDVLDLLILSYVYGCRAANLMLGTSEEPDSDVMQKTIYKKIDDKTFADRIVDHWRNGDFEGIKRVAETETHRLYNAGEIDSARSSGLPVTKTWVTMLDDKVRDTHDYLEGMSIGIDDRFYTYDGDSALYPGEFALAENNVNCRCLVELSLA